MNVDLVRRDVAEFYALASTDLVAAARRAGEEGTVTVSSYQAELLAEALEDGKRERRLEELAADLLKAVVLQGAARAAIPVPEDVRALVRLAREMYSELATPTPWPVPKAEPEDDEE